MNNNRVPSRATQLTTDPDAQQASEKSTIKILSKQIQCAFLKWDLHFSQSCFAVRNQNRITQEEKDLVVKFPVLATHSSLHFSCQGEVLTLI